MTPTPILDVFYQVSMCKHRRSKTHLLVVDLTAHEEGESGSEALLEEHTNFALRVDLASESRHSEFVLRAEGGGRIALAGTHRRRWCVGGLEVESDVNLLRQTLVVARLDDTGRLKLSGGDPRRGEGSLTHGRWHQGISGVGEGGELSKIRSRGYQGAGVGTLDDGLEPNAEAGRDRVQERDHVDTGQVGRRWVDGSQVEREVRSDQVMLELNHGLSGSSRELKVS